MLCQTAFLGLLATTIVVSDSIFLSKPVSTSVMSVTHSPLGSTGVVFLSVRRAQGRFPSHYIPSHPVPSHPVPSTRQPSFSVILFLYPVCDQPDHEASEEREEARAGGGRAARRQVARVHGDGAHHGQPSPGELSHRGCLQEPHLPRGEASQQGSTDQMGCRERGDGGGGREADMRGVTRNLVGDRGRFKTGRE